MAKDIDRTTHILFCYGISVNAGLGKEYIKGDWRSSAAFISLYIVTGTLHHTYTFTYLFKNQQIHYS